MLNIERFFITFSLLPFPFHYFHFTIFLIQGLQAYKQHPSNLLNYEIQTPGENRL